MSNNVTLLGDPADWFDGALTGGVSIRDRAVSLVNGCSFGLGARSSAGACLVLAGNDFDLTAAPRAVSAETKVKNHELC